MSRREVLQLTKKQKFKRELRAVPGIHDISDTKKQKFKRELRAVPGIHDISED